MQLHGFKNPADILARAYVDAHVHIHGCFDLGNFLSAAARNFARHAPQCPSVLKPRFVLCLTESSGVDYFGRLAEGANNSKPSYGQWSVQSSDSDISLLASHPKLGMLEVVAGRQIVTAERLEILALGTTQHWEDGQATRDVIASVADTNAVPVLPWGFGKWLGARGRTVVSLLDQFGGGSLCLGDNAGRPAILPKPAEFERAKMLGMNILPGSDPLPFASEYDRAGSFGFFVDGLKFEHSVWPSLAGILQDGEVELHAFGRLESPARFLRNQIAMQYVMRASKRRKTA